MKKATIFGLVYGVCSLPIYFGSLFIFSNGAQISASTSIVVGAFSSFLLVWLITGVLTYFAYELAGD
jgi:hypothetical protein